MSTFLNYHHLMYFYTVAREGGVARAAEKLHLSSPTISAQIHDLEETLGEKLFDRKGRNLVLTEMGQMVYKYAEDIFSIGRELLDAVKLGPEGRPQRLTVGITDAMPKLLSCLLLEPAMQLEPAVCLVAHEDKIERLLADLAQYRLDVILSDSPLGAGQQIRAYNHLLGECGVSFFGGKNLHAKYARNFPRSLDGAPMFLPSRQNQLRRNLDQFFDQNGIHPQIMGEFEDTGLLKTFGQTGRAIFPAPSLVEEEVNRQYNVKTIGHIEAVRERFYAISPERKLKHPAVVAICAAARKEFFR